MSPSHDPSMALVMPEALHAHQAAPLAVEPDQAVRDIVAGSSKVVISAQLFLCVDQTGHVTEVKIVRGSGLAGYDRPVETAAAAWTFTPFVAHGKPVSVCALDLVGYPPDRSERPWLASPTFEPFPPGSIRPIAEPANVAPTTLEANRIAGDKVITPDDVTKVDILRAGKSKLIGSFKLCVGSSGRVTSVVQLKSTGFPAYDQRLMRRMREWKYLPFRINDVATPVCTAVTFIYSQH
jgi:TonB family protein